MPDDDLFQWRSQSPADRRGNKTLDPHDQRPPEVIAARTAQQLSDPVGACAEQLLRLGLQRELAKSREQAALEALAAAHDELHEERESWRESPAIHNVRPLAEFKERLAARQEKD